jgi:simple sugar transport system substrate-binding protein
VRDEVAGRRQAIVAGKLKPFAAPLVDNSRRTRLAQGALDDAAIATMDWFVQGVSEAGAARPQAR